MGTLIIACQTIKDEVSRAIAETGVDYPVLLIESGLHNYPDLLHKKIQEELNRLDNVEHVLMAFGLCGNSLMGIGSPNARLVVPRVDDCISLLLGSFALRQKLCREAGTYFITKGWLDNEQNLLTEFDRLTNRFGREKALKVMRSIFRHYRRLMVIDTGTFRPEEIRGKSMSIAELFGLEYREVAGSPRYLRKLLTGPWDEEFVVLEPGEEITFDHMNIKLPEEGSDCYQFFSFNA